MIREASVAAIRALANRGRGIKVIARAVGVARNTVRRYVRQPVEPGVQVRPATRRLTDEWRDEAWALFGGPAGGNAALVHRLLAERGISASIRTIQRVVANVRRQRSVTDVPEVPAEHFERWELDLARAVARSARTTDPDELESELTLHLARLQSRFRSRITNWKAFLITALNRKARNWIRNQQTRGKRTTSLNAPIVESVEATSLEETLHATESDPDHQMAIKRAWDELRPELRRVWKALQKEHGNRRRAARRLGVHPNTLRQRIRRIHEIFKRHGA